MRFTHCVSKKIELTADYLMKKQEEREAAIEERARLREERRVAAELAEERARLDKERSHMLNALRRFGAADQRTPSWSEGLPNSTRRLLRTTTAPRIFEPAMST